MSQNDTLWRQTTVSACETFHRLEHLPCYSQRFEKVLKYHAPGLAPAKDQSGAFHIDIQGRPAYAERFVETFGFYEGFAAVREARGCFHILPDGTAAYTQRYLWAGNFQEKRCAVREGTGLYFHIDQTGEPAYAGRYGYVGDFKDGFAVVCTEKGLHTHIDQNGQKLHGQMFVDLDIFHKGFARAKDAVGWFHVDKTGKAIYAERYVNVEPFYNGISRVESSQGQLLTITVEGKMVSEFRPAFEMGLDFFQELSADLVGYWKTQTIYAAVKLGVIDVLPNSLTTIAKETKLREAIAARLLRALWELNIVKCQDGVWCLTPKGELLKPKQTSSMAAASEIWANSHYQQWQFLAEALRDPMYDRSRYFAELVQDPALRALYHSALAGYACQDYKKVVELSCWAQHKNIVDAGGGTGNVLHQLCEKHPHLKGCLIELPAVIQEISAEKRLNGGCAYKGMDFFEPWEVSADAVIFARVLHDWPDTLAVQLLLRARQALVSGGKLYILEMILDDHSPRGGLLDLNMLVMTGGRERSLADWQSILQQAQLRICQVEHFSPLISLLRAEVETVAC